MTGIDANIDTLTKRKYRDRSALVDDLELQLLRMLADGKAIPQMAAKINHTPAAVSIRLRRLFLRINVHNAAHAVAWGFRNGYIQIVPEMTAEEAALDIRYKKSMHDLTGHDVCE